MRIYISGPITGTEDYNQRFEAVEKNLKSIGFDVVNPLKLVHNHGKTYDEFMKVDIQELLKCDAIYMLDNWIQSKGSSIEYFIARSLGIKVVNDNLNNATRPQKSIVEILQILLQRWSEIEAGKNYGTRYPVYAVYTMDYLYFDLNQDLYVPSFNRCGLEAVTGYLYNNGSEYEFCETEDELVKYVNEHFDKEFDDISEIDEDHYSEVQKIAKERLVAIFLTSEAAHNYMERQKHNLSQPYVYVESTGYANYQFEF